MSPAKTLKGAGVVLGPGASANREHSTLVALDDALSPLGAVVERLDLPKRVEAAAAAIASAADGLPKKVDRIVLGGRSFGGRAASMAVSEVDRAAALVLISYPLHPPGKPDQLRVAHLAAIAVPCLFVSGTRDSFATPKELEKATKVVKAPVTHIWIDGGAEQHRRPEAIPMAPRPESRAAFRGRLRRWRQVRYGPRQPEPRRAGTGAGGSAP